ncbi:MAG: hypothetical protein OXG36_16040 [Caldilineaceae bacterium]|nr:hypothetical protein [Caldilineaceae bacterium]
MGGQLGSADRTGRTADQAFFKSVGLAVQDTVSAGLVYARARELDIGTSVSLYGPGLQSVARKGPWLCREGLCTHCRDVGARCTHPKRSAGS